MTATTETAAPVTRAEVCVVAVAECFRGDGEILANPIGTIPMIGGRLARASFEPDLCMTDGEATLVANDRATVEPGERVIEYWNPYRSMFDWVWSGRRHVMMGASQIDRYGNQNLAAIGDYDRPTVQLLGFRGAPGNTINDPTSYWVPNHGPKVFVAAVDTVCGIGWDKAAALGPAGPVRRAPPGGDQPGRVRLRDPGPVDAAALGPPVGERGRGGGGDRLPAGRAGRGARVAAADGGRADPHPRGDRPGRHARGRGPDPVDSGG